METSKKVRQEGDVVIVTDPHGKKHNALITRIHTAANTTAEQHKEMYNSWPCINCVFVSNDKDRTDQYGQQLERYTSLSPYRPGMPNGMFYVFPDEQ